MIVASIVLCKNKRVGFALERLVTCSIEKRGKNIEALFFSLFFGPKRVCLFFIYHQTLHLFMIKTSLKHHKRRKTLSLAKIQMKFKKNLLQIKDNIANLNESL